MNKEKKLRKTQEETKIAKPNIDEETLRVLLEFVKNQSISKTYFWGTIIGIIIGAIYSIAGFIITIMGLSGSIEWFFQAKGFTSKLMNAGPGVFFALLGTIILWRYKPKGKERVEIGSVVSEKGEEKVEIGPIVSEVRSHKAG